MLNVGYCTVRLRENKWTRERYPVLNIRGNVRYLDNQFDIVLRESQIFYELTVKEKY